MEGFSKRIARIEGLSNTFRPGQLTGSIAVIKANEALFVLSSPRLMNRILYSSDKSRSFFIISVIIFVKMRRLRTFVGRSKKISTFEGSEWEDLNSLNYPIDFEML